MCFISKTRLLFWFCFCWFWPGNNQPMQDTDRSTHNTSRQMSIEDAFRQNFKPPPTKRLPTQTLNLTGGTPAQDRSAWSGDRTRNVPVLSGSSAAGSSKTSAFLEPPHNGKGSVAAKKSSRPEAGEPPVVIELDSDQEFEACPSLTSRVRKTLPATSSARMRSDVDRPSPSSRVCSSAATIDLTRDCPQMPVRYICQLRSCDKKQVSPFDFSLKLSFYSFQQYPNRILLDGSSFCALISGIGLQFLFCSKMKVGNWFGWLCQKQNCSEVFRGVVAVALR